MKKTGGIAFVNGRFVPEANAALSIFDRGLLYGDGVYETVRVYDGTPFLLKAHLARLKKSMRALFFPPWSGERWLAPRIERVIEKNKHQEAVVRVWVTRGPGPYGFDLTACHKPSVIITSTPFSPYPAHWKSQGITLAVVSTRRVAPACMPPSAKMANCLNGILAQREARQWGAQEALLLTLKRTLAEGSVSNIFLVKNRALWTPPDDGHILPGVTREWVVAAARGADHRVHERTLTLRHLQDADEIFITNSTMEIMPVRRVVGGARWGGRPGPLTRQLQSLFEAARSRKPIM